MWFLFQHTSMIHKDKQPRRLKGQTSCSVRACGGAIKETAR